MRVVVLLAVLSIPSALACQGQKNAFDPKSRIDGGPITIAGVIPDKFDCKAFLPDAPSIVGGEVSWIPPEFAPQQGTAPACGFSLKSDETKAWQFTIDCRPVAEGEIELILKTKGSSHIQKQIVGGAF